MDRFRLTLHRHVSIQYVYLCHTLKSERLVRDFVLKLKLPFTKVAADKELSVLASRSIAGN